MTSLALTGHYWLVWLCVLESSDATVWVTVIIFHLAKKLQVMTLLGNLHFSPTESVLQRSVVLLGDGDWKQAYRPSSSAEAGPRCVNHATLKRFFHLLMCFRSTLETRLRSLLLFSPTSVS